MSDSDAQYYNNEIDKLYNDSRRITQLIKNETSIVEASINRANEMEAQMNKRLTEILKVM